MDFDAELNAAVAAAFHDTPFTYAPPGGAAGPELRGDFRRDTVDVAGDDGTAPVTMRAPTLGVRLSDFPAGAAPEEDGTVTIGAAARPDIAGTAWRVARVDDNGAGMAWLHLNRIA